MRFELSDDQQLLRSSTRDFFTKAAPLEQSRRVMEQEPRGFETPQWRQLAEMGYVGLGVPGDHGGRGRRAAARPQWRELREMVCVGLGGPGDRGGRGLGAIALAIVAEEAGRVC